MIGLLLPLGEINHDRSFSSVNMLCSNIGCFMGLLFMRTTIIHFVLSYSIYRHAIYPPSPTLQVDCISLILPIQHLNEIPTNPFLHRLANSSILHVRWDWTSTLISRRGGMAYTRVRHADGPGGMFGGGMCELPLFCEAHQKSFATLPNMTSFSADTHPPFLHALRSYPCTQPAPASRLMLTKRCSHLHAPLRLS